MFQTDTIYGRSRLSPMFWLWVLDCSYRWYTLHVEIAYAQWCKGKRSGKLPLWVINIFYSLSTWSGPSIVSLPILPRRKCSIFRTIRCSAWSLHFGPRSLHRRTVQCYIFKTHVARQLVGCSRFFEEDFSQTSKLHFRKVSMHPRRPELWRNPAF